MSPQPTLLFGENYQAVNALWKSFRDYQIIGLIICEKGCEGKAIGDFRMAIAKKRKCVKEPGSVV